MKIKAQMAMVMNLDKCLACHTCAIPCKNAWTTPAGSEYIWFNNVETKPGIGYPKRWEDQKIWRGGWELEQGEPKLRSGGKIDRFLKIFGNSNLPAIEDYYEPWNYNYKYLTEAPAQERQPAVGPRSAITGEPMKVEWGPNWEDDLAGVNVTGLEDVNFRGMQAKAWLQFKSVFMFHLPRICEHCLHPACVASCPSGALYKREEDGIVLADQTRCRSWRMCMSACPYKKVYLNWKTHRSEKCIFCYPRIEAGHPTLCAQSCPGRIRYVGVMLYDADKVKEAASAPNAADVYESQLAVFLNPHDPDILAKASEDGVSDHFLEAAKKSPIYKLVSEWKVALPLHPEFRTLPMVWYVPPMSPLVSGGVKSGDQLDNMRIPLKYLANLLAAGDEKPVRGALGRLLAMRAFMRSQRFAENAALDETGTKPAGQDDFAADAWGSSSAQPTDSDIAALEAVGLSPETARAMYRMLAIARFDERFAVPTSQREYADNVDDLKGKIGYPEPLS
ncbi:MAG: nitrate reductase subunit beta [Desulfovibrio sp.]|nr:nitrate reductase subunit beta [Desulfovibrio sp.]